jgi:hypothetical protein
MLASNVHSLVRALMIVRHDFPAFILASRLVVNTVQSPLGQGSENL